MDAALTVGARRRGSSVADRRAHAYRLRQPAQAGHLARARRAARRGRGAPDEARARLARGPRVLRAGGGAARVSARRSSAARRSRPRGGAAWTRYRRRASRRWPREFARALAGELPDGWEAHLPIFTPADGEMATRDAGGKVINALAGVVTNLVGGSADLDPSTRTAMKGCGDFESPLAAAPADAAADTGHGRRRLGLRRTQHPFRRARARDGRGR